jgi:lysophospholipase L1-like esterase
MDRRWVLGGILLAGGYGFIRAVASRPRLSAESRVLLVGDSMAQGMLPHLRGLATTAEIPYIGAGLPGTTILQWLSSDWLRRKLAEFKPTHVLISLGTNDAFSGVDPEKAGGRAASLVQSIQDTGAHPIWVGAPSLPANYAGKHPDSGVLQKIKDAAPYYFSSEEYVIPRGPDDLHPSAAGYAGWAGAIWNWLS